MGALGGTRTPNLLIRSQMLYPLSYERWMPDSLRHLTWLLFRETHRPTSHGLGSSVIAVTHGYLAVRARRTDEESPGMTSADLLMDAFGRIRELVHEVVADLTPEQLAFRAGRRCELDRVAGVAPDPNPGRPHRGRC